jgi:hypothetical protein
MRARLVHPVLTNQQMPMPEKVEIGGKPFHSLAFLAVVGLSLMAGGYWFVGLCYSRGYDYFLWLYNAWLVGETAWRGSWPNWSAYSAAGHPFFKTAGVADAFIFSLFTQSAGFELGTQIYTCLLYVTAGAGMYALVCHLGGARTGAVVAAAAYVFSWFMTFTVYYQTYLNNFLTYAIMPWAALFFIKAIAEQSRRYLFAAAGMLFLSVTSNAQVSIKLILFVVPLAFVETVICRSLSWRRWFAYSAVLGAMALSWAVFLIVPALELRKEVFLLGGLRSVQFIKPWEVLVSIPLYAINMLYVQLGGRSFLAAESLSRAIYTDYIGLSVAAVVFVGVFAYWRRGDRRLQWTVWLLVFYWALYFLAVPNLGASVWLGITHNWAILPTLVLAMLCRYGCEWLQERWSRRWAVALLCALVVADLGGASFSLNYLAVTHQPLESLPEVEVWRRVEESESKQQSGRWFTYNPDHTHYLMPIFTGRATANIVELRSRNPEYNAYIVHQREALRALDASYNPSESLAILDCRYLDVPLKVFDYRGDSAAFTTGVELLRADPQLDLLYERPWNKSDAVYDAMRADLDVDYILNRGGSSEQIAQVVFRNRAHFPGVVAQKTVLIAGDTAAGEELFERITHLPAYRARAILFVLDDSAHGLDPRVKQSFDACMILDGGIAPVELPIWDMQDLTRVYEDYADGASVEVQIKSEQAERLLIGMPNAQRDRFLFLSRQRFNDWHAYGGAGARLPVLKAGAGLTAIWLPAGTTQVTYQYEVPLVERLARYYSLITFVGALLLCCWRRENSYRPA